MRFFQLLLFLSLLVVNWAIAAPPSIIELRLSGDDVISLDRINVSGNYTQKRTHTLDNSHLYNRHIGRVPNLYTYITRLPNVLDAYTLDGIYNLNVRGVNTSPLNGHLPIDIVIDGISFSDNFASPRHAYLLPRIEYYAGVDAFNDLSSGSQGVVSVTTANISRGHSGNLTLQGDLYEQKLFGFLSGKIGDLGYYGINFNGVNRPGRYTNRFAKSLVDENNEVVVTNKTDDQINGYTNAYVLFSVSDVLEARVYGIVSAQNRNFLQGYQTTPDQLDDFLSPADYDTQLNETNLLTTTNASADVVGAYHNSNSSAVGIDGSYYLQQSIFEFGVNGQTNLSEKALHIGNSENNVSGLNAVYKEDEILQTSKLELVLRFKPVSIDYTKYRLGVNLRYYDRSTDLAKTTIYAHSAAFGDSKLLLDHSYSSQTLYGQAYGDYKFEFGDWLKVDVGGLLVYYSSTLDQFGEISENDSTNSNYLGILAGLNQRLRDVGAATQYTPGDIDATSTFTSQAVLPKLSIAAITNPYDWEVHYLLNYYEGYIPGGINPYAISDDGLDNNVYQAQLNKTAELGIDFYSTFNFKLMFFGVQMTDVHFIDSLNGLEKYYGNADSATSLGGELTSSYRIFANWEIDLLFTMLDATYDTFTHTPFANAGSTTKLDYSGNKVILSPEYTARLGTSYWMKSGFYFRVEALNFGSHYFDYANELENEGYTIVNAELGWENKTWALEFYTHNLLNQEYNKGVTYNPYNSTGTALEQANKNSINPSTFNWENTVMKHIGQPLTAGLSVVGRF